MKQRNNKILVLVGKDVLNEARTKEVVTSVFIFAFLAVLVFALTMEQDPATIRTVAPGMLWVSFTFAGVLGFNRSFVQEKERACLDGLMLCPIPREAIYWGKLLGNLVFMLVVEIIILPIFFGLFNLPFGFFPEVALVVLVTTLGFVSVGTLFSAMSVNTRARDIMMPILFLPVVIPVLIAAGKSTGIILNGGGWSDVSSWMEMVLAFDVIFMVTSSYLFRFAIEE